MVSIFFRVFAQIKEVKVKQVTLQFLDMHSCFYVMSPQYQKIMLLFAMLAWLAVFSVILFSDKSS